MPDIPLSLYIHFPWCAKKCPYCDFNSHALSGELPEQAYVDALIQDLQQQLEKNPGRMIQTVFMGGGTPSLITPPEIKRLMNALRASGRLTEGAEITLEANPGTLDETHYEDYLAAGINRLSIGVQSFDDALLKAVGRIHSAEQAQYAIARATKAGFERINLDLMYGLPGQSVEALRRDIELALLQGVNHLSVYQLTIEPNTQFAVHTPPLPDSDLCWLMHEQAQSLLQTAGFEQYEVSAYTRNSTCRHNLNYWQFGDYLAIGAGAHGKLSGLDDLGNFSIRRYWNHRHPKAYLQAAKSGEFAAQSKVVPQKERDLEFLMNALRLRLGFNLAGYACRTQGAPEPLLTMLKPFFDKGWLQHQGENIRATETGFRFLDSILLECL
ncbi:MAG: radical SAM family heme chaperone HemW [Proteobacteria bacterium]|nr:radical SAM family heme chaperone HemW [Pseudomonadota bacterium]